MVVLGREREDLDPFVSQVLLQLGARMFPGGKIKKSWYLGAQLVFEMLMEIMEAEFL